MRKLISFGFKHGAPTHGAVIDVRKYLPRNPYHNKALRSLRGTDPAVQEDIMKTPGINESLQQLVNAVRVEFILTDTVCLGCTGGHHRSVFAAELIGKMMTDAVVEHRDINR